MSARVLDPIHVVSSIAARWPSAEVRLGPAGRRGPTLLVRVDGTDYRLSEHAVAIGSSASQWRASAGHPFGDGWSADPVEAMLLAWQTSPRR